MDRMDTKGHSEHVLCIGGKDFTLVVTQRVGSSVYRGNGEYLRIGPPEVIERNLLLHRMMEREGFPVAPLISEGEHDGQRYFIEKSLGNKRLNDTFADDLTARGSISDEHFQDFLEVAKKFTAAQLKTRTDTKDADAFAQAVHLPTLCKELPEYADRLRRRFTSALQKLKDVPYVLTHGDFNPANIYPSGVIDFEDAFYGPMGYDNVTALITTDWFPASKEFEYFQRYHYIERQKKEYFDAIDRIFIAAGLEPLSSTAGELAFLRSIWHVVRMAEWPKIQKWRYDKFIATYL